MSDTGSASSPRHWPDEPRWTRKLRRFRGRLDDDPQVSHLLARIHTTAKVNGTDVARAGLLLTERGKPLGSPKTWDTGPVHVSPEVYQGFEVVLGASGSWSPEDFLEEIGSTIDRFIEHSKSTTSSYRWHVLHAGDRDDIHADWCLVFARDDEHAIRKPTLSDGDRWGDRPGLESLGSWQSFRAAVECGGGWPASSDSVSMDSTAPVDPPDDLCDVLGDASI